MDINKKYKVNLNKLKEDMDNYLNNVTKEELKKDLISAGFKVTEKEEQ